MKKIQTVSHYLTYVFMIIFGLIALQPFFFWGFYDALISTSWHEYFSYALSTPNGVVIIGQKAFPGLSKFVFFTADFLMNIVGLVGIFYLVKLFRLYKNYRIFTIQNAYCFRALGSVILFQALIAEPLTSSLKILAATLPNPPGQRILSIGFGSSGISLILIGLVVLLISWVMEEASKLQDDSALTI